ncbi:MAG TPA: SRPBCC family protein [Tepidiformaceae bacterium]|nr:SRPBCC family protein [Tepidiformaceae bacterium]
MTKVVWKSWFPLTPETLYEFHTDPANLAAISPPWPPFTMISDSQPSEVGGIQVFRLGSGPLATVWEARIRRLEPGRLVEDTLESGPFRAWRHQHQFLPEGDGAILKDVVAFRFFPTPLGGFLDYLFVRPFLLGMFAWRHRRTRQLLVGDQN